jgi:hypothetical protein
LDMYVLIQQRFFYSLKVSVAFIPYLNYSKILKIGFLFVC